MTGIGLVAAYSARFWLLVVALGVVAGVSAGILMLALRATEWLTYGLHRQTLLATVVGSPDWRRLLVLLLAALIVVGGLALLGRRPTGGTEVSSAIWFQSGRLALIPSLGRGLLSIVAVGMGVSLGREAAPQLYGAACASRVAQWAGLPVWQRRLLVAAGAGAGFAAVYNVPLGGALFALEVMLGTLALPLVLPALLMSLTATATAWLFLGTRPVYQLTADRFHASQLVFALALGPIIGVVATGWAWLVAEANRRKPTSGHGRWLVPVAVFTGLGLLAFEYPQLLGNGHGIVQLSLAGGIGLGLLVTLLVLKPLVTAGCIASGCPGGLFTPTLATGVLLASSAGAVWTQLWPGAVPGSYALIGGGAFLAAAMQGPLSGLVLILELTRHFDSLMVPTLLAVVEATIVSRRLGAKSIYSARVSTVGALDPDVPAWLGTPGSEPRSAIFTKSRYRAPVSG